MRVRTGKCLIQAGFREPAAIVRKPCGRPASVRKIVFAAALQRPLIRRALVNPLHESRYVGERLRARALSSGFKRETHLHVGGAEGVAGKPLGLRSMKLSCMVCAMRRAIGLAKNGIGALPIRSATSFNNSGGMAEPSA